jgi:hypothetical protein
MRFLITVEWSSKSEADQVRVLDMFNKWTPPVPLTEWSGFADGSGFMAIAETDDVGALAAIAAPWTAYLDFTVRALQPIQQTAEVMASAIEFRNAVG